VVDLNGEVGTIVLEEHSSSPWLTSTLKIEAVCSAEMVVPPLPDDDCHIPDDCNMNLKRTQPFIQDKYMTVEILQDFIL
jgi:hypothetical protein